MSSLNFDIKSIYLYRDYVSLLVLMTISANNVRLLIHGTEDIKIKAQTLHCIKG